MKEKKFIELNGWWDFACVSFDSQLLVNKKIPDSGWYIEKYMVPSIWNKSKQGVKSKSEKYYKRDRKRIVGENDDFLFDAYDYPNEWTNYRNAFLRRKFEISSKNAEKRYMLKFEAVAPFCEVFLNSSFIGENRDPSLPFEFDISNELISGDNEIVVLVKDFDRDDRNRPLVPSGNEYLNELCGIWQDVYIEEESKIFIDEVCILTSVRKETLTVKFKVKNFSDYGVQIAIDSDVFDFLKNKSIFERQPVLKFFRHEVDVKKDEYVDLEFQTKWKNPTLWSPANPKLYTISFVIKENNTIREIYTERFGFREVWIEGYNLILNGSPIHLFSDWGHKMSPYCHTEKWVKKWYSMIKDCNMNHSRLHTHPHPKIYLDIADEEGILITGETAVHGSGGEQGSDSTEYWEAAIDHVKRFIKRDRNHPCIILWSVENEMRWNGDKTVLTKKMLPKLKNIFNESDPTRPAYHEGDSSIWDENHQDIISRHYGKDCSGEGWWDKKRPLHSGEMSIYHYAGPNNTLHLAGDRVWAEYSLIDIACALDTKYIVEAGRTNGVCCFGPWNISCHQNLRLYDSPENLSYDNFESRGVKPLYVKKYASEFAFWESGQGYFPNKSFFIQKQAFRPLAVIDKNLRTSYFQDDMFIRNLSIVNDTYEDIKGELNVTCEIERNVFFKKNVIINILKGEIKSVDIKTLVPENDYDYEFKYRVEFKTLDGTQDKWDKIVRAHKRLKINSVVSDSEKLPLYIFGYGYMKEYLEKNRFEFIYLSDLSELPIGEKSILIIEKDSILPGSNQLKFIKKFASDGGRVLIMEQKNTLFSGLEIDIKPVLKAFIRRHSSPLIEGMTDDDFFMWGDDTYAVNNSDSFVSNHMYKKNDASVAEFILDSGEGSFGSGDTDYSPLIEVKWGKGLIVGCQLRLTEKLESIPQAERILFNTLKYLHSDMHSQEKNISAITASKTDKKSIMNYIKMAKRGETIYVEKSSWETLNMWSECLGNKFIPIISDDEYQLVKVSDKELVTEGVSNWDICGIETYCYDNVTGNQNSNVKIGSTFILPDVSIKEILVTPVNSCLKELMVYNGKTEVLRSPFISEYLYSNPRKHLVGLCSIDSGAGLIIFNQFEPDEYRERFTRCENTIKKNLGIKIKPHSIMKGISVPKKNSYYSKGYPEKIYVFKNNISESGFQKMVALTVPGSERMPTAPILDTGGWQEVKSEDNGMFKIDADNTECSVLLYYRIATQTTRENIKNNLGIPNPEALTYLDIFAKGKFEIVINKTEYSNLFIENSKGTLNEISLIKGYNHILIRWYPENIKNSIAMKWRNIMRQPEIEFMFL